MLGLLRGGALNTQYIPAVIEVAPVINPLAIPSLMIPELYSFDYVLYEVCKYSINIVNIVSILLNTLLMCHSDVRHRYR